jgi:hypothetical protein
MSDYFQRLIQQSDLQLPAAAAVTPRPSASPVLSEPPLSATAADDLVEIHDEQVAESQPRAANATPSLPVQPQTDPSQAEPVVALARESAPFAAGPVSPATAPAPSATRESSTTVIAPSPAMPGSPSADKPAATESVRVERMPAPAAASGQPASAPSQADVMQAVMKWIAAGSAGPGNAEEKREAPVAEKTISLTEAPVSPTPPAQPKPAPEKIPDRVIQLVEAKVSPTREPAPVVAVRPVAPPPARTAASAPEAPVRVSIGSIQVNVEAPAPAPKPVRGARTAESNRPAPRTSRSSTASQLRRHYIIPH